jgi:hypothetical protein
VNVCRLDRLLIAAVGLHSLVLGTALLVHPAWILGMAGWQYDGPLFFPAQSGIFLLILGGAYLAGIRHRPFAWLLVASKAAAVTFLLVEYALGNGPVLLLPAAVFDGLMGLAVAVAVIRCDRVRGALEG